MKLLRSCAAALGVLLQALLPAHAGLGGLSSSPAADAQSWNAAAPLAQNFNAYVRYAIQTEQGGQVLEFADATGLIFAVAWHTPVLPDMATLLGSYQPRLARAQRESRAAQSAEGGERAARRHFSSASSDLVIESHGHMRGFDGLAYLPAKLPAGVKPEQLQ